MLNGELVISVS